MPLINLQTNLKSLKFGKDRPGGGSSNQPYIQKDIPNTSDPSNVFNTGGPDFLLRGGLIAPLKAADDTSRLTQMFFDLKSPNGLLFTTKENLLSRTAVKTEASTGAGYGAGIVNAGIYTPISTLGQAASGFSGTHLNLLGLDPSGLSSLGLNSYFDVVKERNNSPGSEDNRLVGLYTQISQSTSTTNFSFQKGIELNNGVNLLSYPGGPGSVLGIGNTNIKFADQRTGNNNALAVKNPTTFYTGSRWNDRTQGNWISPLAKGVSSKYEAYTGESGSLTLKEGSPIISPDGGYTFNQNWDLSTTKSGSLEAQDLEQNNDHLFPGINYTASISPNGVSNLYNSLVSEISQEALLDNEYTNRNFFNVYDPNTTPGNTWPTNTSLQTANYSSTFTQQQIIETTPVSKGGELQDFRTKLVSKDTEASTIMSLAPNYKMKNIENRVNLGNPGTAKNVIKYSANTQILDKINGSLTRKQDIGGLHGGIYNDLVKFSIGKVMNATEARYMNFRAFIDSFDDNYTSDWSEIQYIGRPDKFYNFTGFNRTINMSWTVYAQSKDELIPMYRKLNYLAGSLAGTMNSNSGYMQGNLHRLTVGGYLYNQLGIIKGLTYSVPTESPWEIGINEEGGFDNTVKELPFMIKITGFQFIPIHDFVPQAVLFDKTKPNNPEIQRYIALSNGGNNNYDSGPSHL